MAADDAGARKQFTLDAASGEVLDVTVLTRRETPPAAPGGDLAPPGAPLAPPQHAPDSAATPVDAKAAPSPRPAASSTRQVLASSAWSPGFWFA